MNKTNKLPTRPLPPLQPWKVVRGHYRSIQVYKLPADRQGVCALQSPGPRYFTTSSALEILQLARLLTDTPPVPKARQRNLPLSILQSPQAKVAGPKAG